MENLGTKNLLEASQEFEPVNTAEMIQVIHVQAKKGRGVKDSPLRLIDQYWSLDGLLLAEVDAWKVQFAPDPSRLAMPSSCGCGKEL